MPIVHISNGTPVLGVSFLTTVAQRPAMGQLIAVCSTKTLPTRQIKLHGMQAEITKPYKLSGPVTSKL
jgi:hypothetical protein